MKGTTKLVGFAAISLAFILILMSSQEIKAEPAISIPTIEYEPAYNDLKIIRAGDMVNISWNTYQEFDNETNITSTFYRDYAIIRIFFFYVGNNQTYSFSEAVLNYGVAYGTWINYNTGTSAKWGGTVNTDAVSQTIKDNGYYLVFELVEGTGQPKPRDGKLWLDPYVSIDFKDLDNPLNQFRIFNRTLVYLTNNGSAFHDTLTFDPIITVENVTINSKLNNIRTDDTFTYLEIDDSDDVYLEFDGDGDYVGFPVNITPVGNVSSYTISTWIKYNGDTGDAGYIIGNAEGTNDTFILSIASSTNRVNFQTWNDSGISAGLFSNSDTVVVDGQWHHIVASYNGSKVRVWLDTIKSSEEKDLTGLTRDGVGNSMEIGGRLTDFSFNGAIDEVRIYNISLSVRDISELYNSTRVANSSIPNSSDLVGWWQMDEGVSQTAFDSSQEGNNGTLVADTSWSTWGLGDNLVGYWSFDGDAVDTATTTHYDFSYYNNDGVGLNEANTSAVGCMDNYGNCLQLDGAGDYINAGSDSSLDITGTTLSISAWIYATGLVDEQPIVMKAESGSVNEGFGLYWVASELVFYVTDTGNIASKIFTSEDNWHHVVGTYDGTDIDIYVDGVAGTSDDYTGNILTASAPLEIGALSGPGWYFNGSIDEVMIFNTSLSAAQVAAIYFNSSARFKTTANQTILPVNITDGNDRANVTATFSNNMSSNISLRLGQMNITNQTGLVLYMPMEWGNQTDNQVWDISGQANHGTPYQDAIFNSTGGLNETGGWEFDGSGDYITTSGPTTGINFTITAWIKPITTATYGTIVSQDTNNALFVEFDGNLNFYDGAHCATDYKVTDDQWYFVVAVMNDTNRSIYINGEINKTCVSVGGWSISYIGISTNVNEVFNGTIDEVMIFNRSLSADEISQMYNDTIEEYNQIYYTPYQNLTHGSNIYTISDEADFIFPQIRPYAGNSTATPFYTPIMFNDIVIETYQVNDAPTHTTPVLNATDDPSNLTTANLTCYNQSTFDADKDNVKNIYNWYVDDAPIAVLNMPFEAGGNGTLNESNFTKDYSGLGNNGTVILNSTMNGIWNSTGGYDGRGAYEFSGTNSGDYILVDDNGDSFGKTVCNNGCTFSAWAKKSNLGAIGKILGRWDLNDRYFVLQITINDFIQFSLGNGTTECGPINDVAISQDVWYHYVGVWNTTNVIIYKNGVFAASKGVGDAVTCGFGTDINSAYWASRDEDVFIGLADDSNLLHEWNGSIDDVLIFNRSLSAEQIWQLYIQNTSDYTPQLIVADETSEGEEWICEVTPNDGTEDGIAKNSSTLTIESAVADTTNPDNVGFLFPTPLNDTNLTINNYFVNVSFNDSFPNSCLLELTNTSGTINYTMTEGANVSEWYINTSHTNNATWFTTYCRDDASNWNNSITRHVNISVTAVGDTCDTCTIDCSENCIVDSELDCGGNPLSFFNGPGVIGIQADIKNWNKVLTDNSGCGIICDGGCIL